MTKTCRFSIIFVLTLLTVSVQAATNYWDGNDATPGAGVAPSGTWSTDAFWSNSPEGTNATTTWTTGDDAVFSAGTDATGEYTVTLGSATANSFRIEEGTVILGGSGAVTLGTGTATVEAGATLVTGNSARMSAVAGSRLILRGGHKKCTNTGNAGSFVDADMAIELDGGGTISHTVAGA